MGRSNKECKHKYCNEYPFAGEFCEKHDVQQRKQKLQSDGGRRLLSGGLVDGKPITNPEFKKTVLKLNKYHHLIAPTLQANREINNGISLGVANDAQQWCLRIAEHTWSNEMSFRSGWEGHFDQHNEEYLWERLAELDIFIT